MIVRFYTDLWTGLDPPKHTLFATTSPTNKSKSTKRLAFDVMIPDHLIYDIDAVSPEIASPVLYVADETR